MLGDFIKERLKICEMTQKELANKVFVSRDAITKWCNNKRIPEETLLKKVAEALDVDEKHLIELRNKSIKERKNMNSEFDIRFKKLTDDDVEKFVDDLLENFKFDENYKETFKYLTKNYLIAIVLSELDYRDNKMEKDDIFDIYNLQTDLRYNAINNELYKGNFNEAYDRHYHMSGSNRDSIVSYVYECNYFMFREFPDDVKLLFRFTLLRLSEHIKSIV